MIKKIFSILKSTLSKIWDGFLQNAYLYIFILISSGGYVTLNAYVKGFEAWVNSLSPNLLFTITFGLTLSMLALAVLYFKQRGKILKLERFKNSGTLITHWGVWWRIYHERHFIEDMPYCPCCETPQKLVQIEWHPDEVYKCANKGTEIKLFDAVPRKRRQLLETLYDMYFPKRNRSFVDFMYSEMSRLKELNPDWTEEKLLEHFRTVKPLSKIPQTEFEKIKKRYPKIIDIIHFIDRHYEKYGTYLREKR